MNAISRIDCDVKCRVSAEEWETRVDLAAAYRLVALFGWDDLVFTHISARVPGTEHHFLINPYGMMFEEIVRVQAGGGELVPIGQSILDGATAAAKEVTRGLGASLVWPGLLRRLDRRNPGYAQ